VHKKATLSQVPGFGIFRGFPDKVVYTFYPPSGPERILVVSRPNTKMLWVETPSNPLLMITDQVGQT